MAREEVIPCPLCGYHAPTLACPHCDLAPREPSLRGRRGGFLREVRDGWVALAQGARVLLATPGTKRLLVPPVLLTGLLFGAVFAWSLRLLSTYFDAVNQAGVEQLDLAPGWWRDVLVWLAGLEVVVWIAHASGVVIVLLALSLAALWTFSIAYEAICGPFLDTIQARVEVRWFGLDPRAELERPPGVDPARSARWAALAGLTSMALVVAFRVWRGAPWAWALLVAAPLPFLLAGGAIRGFSAWLGWFLGTQLRALWTSVKASLLAALILVAFLWVKLVPVFGLPLFAMVAGFATALTLLDIPFSRRGWRVRQRVTFLFQHLPAIVSLGVATSLVFVVPFVGPLVGVPSASLGGLWLLCRLDKNGLRPPGRRVPIPDGAAGAEVAAGAAPARAEEQRGAP